METLLKADIFFFISTLATVVLTVFVSILLVYLIKASKSLRNLLEVLENSFNNSEEYITDLKDRLEDNIVFRIFFPAFKKHKAKTAKKKGKAEDEDKASI